MRMAWVLLLITTLAVVEATPPGIANNPSHASCMKKEYKDCYNLVHVCPKFCPDSCHVHCASCKPICGSETPEEAPPTPSPPSTPVTPSPPPTPVSPPPALVSLPPTPITPSPPPTPETPPPTPVSPPPTPETPPSPPPTPTTPSPPTTPVTPTRVSPPPTPETPPPTPVSPPPTPLTPSPPPTPISQLPTPVLPPPTPETPSPPPTPVTPSPALTPVSPPPTLVTSSPPPTTPVVSTTLEIPPPPPSAVTQSPPLTPVTSPPTQTPAAPPTPPTFETPSSSPPFYPPTTSPSLPITPPPSSPDMQPPTIPAASAPPTLTPSSSPSLPDINSPPTPALPPSNTHSPTPPTTTPPSSPSPPDYTDEAAGRRKRCRNRYYPQCYGVQHVCPSSCPYTCEVDCVTCRPVCSCDRPGAVCQDPRFIGGDGITFYFHGKKDKNFCLVTDPNLHINAHFIGKRNENIKRDFTWVQSIGILFGSHRLFLGAQKTATWDSSTDRLALSFDGEPIVLPTKEGATWEARTLYSIVVKRDGNTNSITTKVDGLFKISVKVVPITKRESDVHNYGITNDDCFAHLELGFKLYSVSEKMDGVLGQTYRSGYVSRAKMGVAMPVLGGHKAFKVSNLFATDCSVSKFEDVKMQLDSDSDLELPSMKCGSGIGGRGFFCKR